MRAENNCDFQTVHSCFLRVSASSAKSALNLETSPKRARVFYTSLGHPDDFKNAEFRRLLANGIAWAMGK